MRRRWKLLIAITAFIAFIGLAFAFRPEQPDDLDFLKPFIISDHTRYIALGSGATTSCSSDRKIIIGKDDQSRLINLIHNTLAEQDGWHTYFTADMLFELSGSKTDPSSGSLKTVARIDCYISGDNTVTIYLDQDLTPWEVFVIRAENIGHDPFQHIPLKKP